MNSLKVITHFTKTINYSIRFNYATKVFLSTSSDFKDIIKVEQQNVLTQNIKSANDTFELLDIISTSGKDMNQTQTMLSLKSLFALQKTGKSSLPSTEIIKNPEFQLLCHKLKTQARHLEVNDIIESLKVLAFMNVPSNSNIVMVLLNLVRHQINDITLGHIIFLDFLLSKMKSTPLVEALKIAMPLLFQIQVNYKMDHENVPQLVDLLQYTAKHKVPEQCMMNVITALTLHGKHLPPDAAKRIIWSLCDLPTFSQFHEKLLLNVVNIFIQNINEYSFETVDMILTKTMDKYLNNKQQNEVFYNESFFNKCADYVVETNQDFFNAVYILKKFNKTAFVNIKLLEYISNLVIQNPSQLEKTRPTVLFTFVTGFSFANYIPNDWEKIIAIMKTNPIFNSTKIEYPWIKFTLELLSLNCYDEKLLEKIFSNEFLGNYLIRDYVLLDHLQLLTLCQCMKVLHPEVKLNFPDQKYIDKGVELMLNRTEFPLKKVLEFIYGGPQFVQTKVKTKLGHLIDHVVLFSKDTEDSELQVLPHNIDFSEENYIPCYEQYFNNNINAIPIAIVCNPQSAYPKNLNRMKATAELRLRVLAAMGITTVCIPLKQWNELPEHERIDYIKQEIYHAIKNKL